MIEFLEQIYTKSLDIPIIAGLLAFVFLVITRSILISSLKNIYRKIGSKSARIIQQGISKLSLLFIASVSLYIFVNELIPKSNIRALGIVKSVLLTIIIFSVVKSITSSIAEYSRIKTIESEDKNVVSAISYISIILRAVIWLFAVAFIMDSIGYDANALLTGLGLSGLAIAFALRNSIRDVIASFIIIFDKPIRIGDRVVVEKKKGIVEKVGLKSTILVQEDGRRYILPNSFITEKGVKNFQGDESQDFELEMSLKKKKVKFNISKSIKDKLKADFNDVIKPDLMISLKEISEEHNTFKIALSLWNRQGSDEKIEQILSSLESFLKESKLDLVNLKIVDEE